MSGMNLIIPEQISADNVADQQDKGSNRKFTLKIDSQYGSVCEGKGLLSREVCGLLLLDCIFSKSKQHFVAQFAETFVSFLNAPEAMADLSSEQAQAQIENAEIKICLREDHSPIRYAWYVSAQKGRQDVDFLQVNICKPEVYEYYKDVLPKALWGACAKTTLADNRSIGTRVTNLAKGSSSWVMRRIKDVAKVFLPSRTSATDANLIENKGTSLPKLEK